MSEELEHWRQLPMQLPLQVEEVGRAIQCQLSYLLQTVHHLQLLLVQSWKWLLRHMQGQAVHTPGLEDNSPGQHSLPSQDSTLPKRCRTHPGQHHQLQTVLCCTSRGKARAQQIP